MAPRVLVALLCALIFAPAAQAGGAAPGNLHAFLLRSNEAEDPTRTYARTPSFAWNPIRGATSYEFQLSSSRTFAENAIVWENESLKTPLTTIPITLPWTTGSPYSFYARVRANLGQGASGWSEKYGFRLRAPVSPASLSSGLNPQPGLVRWTPVEGATAYEVSLLYDLARGEKKLLKTATTAADLREYYTLHNDTSQPEIGQITWRVRAVREVEGKALNHLPAVSYGPWSRSFLTVEPPLGSGQIVPREAISRSRANDVVSNPASPGDIHELAPAFWWDGRLSVDDLGDCPQSIQSLGVTCPLFHVYVFTDEDCVNRVHVSDLVGSPAYAPRLSEPLAYPSDPLKLSQAVNLYLGDGEEGDVYDAGGESVYAAGMDPLLPLDPAAADLPEGEKLDRRSGLWDADWPDSRYYWTAVPAVPRITPESTVEYHDVGFAEDMCQAGRSISFGKTSAPAIEKANGVPYASGLTSGALVRSATTNKPTFFGRALIAWKPAPGATRYQVQWSKRAVPFRPVGTAKTPATAMQLTLDPGVWYYRVRGIDGSLPTLNQGMTWSDPQYLKIAKTTYTVVKKRRR